jgi:uncharacterized spore protein YtfJ
MPPLELVSGLRDALTVQRVFGAPIERDGVTVVPVAKVRGAGGGGGGSAEEQAGEGGGFIMSAEPVGVYVLREGKVRWEPAFDLNRTVLLGQAVLLAAVLLLRRALPRR